MSVYDDIAKRMNEQSAKQWKDIQFILNGKVIKGVVPIDYKYIKQKPMAVNPTVKKLREELSSLKKVHVQSTNYQGNLIRENQTLQKNFKDSVADRTRLTEELRMEKEKNESLQSEYAKAKAKIAELEGGNKVEHIELKLDEKVSEKIEAFVAAMNKKRPPSKQVSIDIMALCSDAKVEWPTSMSIHELKRVIFLAQNIFQEAKALGE